MTSANDTSWVCAEGDSASVNRRTVLAGHAVSGGLCLQRPNLWATATPAAGAMASAYVTANSCFSKQ